MDNALRFRTLAVAVLSALLAACTVGPNHVRPDIDVPERFVHTQGSAGSDVPFASDVASNQNEFWHSLGDVQLSHLIERTLAANHDLRIALSRYDGANSLLRGVALDRWPAITMEAGISESRSSADQLPGSPRESRDHESYSIGARVGWELDFFGRVRRSMESQTAQAHAAAAELQALQVVLVAEAASSYVTLRGLQERLDVAKQSAASQASTLELIERGLAAGRGTEFDLVRVRGQLEATAARIPALEAQIALIEHRLAVLSGEQPGALVELLESTRGWPSLPMGLDPATPGDLLRRRPDVLAAEHRLHAATAQIGIATADLFPRFTLGGLLGSHALDSDDLFGRDSETRVVALGVDWSFLDAGRVRARIAAADATAAGTLASYEKTVLLALEETESALVRYARAQAEHRHWERAARDSARAAELARTRHRAGVGTLLEVLDAERSSLQARDATVQSRAATLSGLIQVYRAMAGGWRDRLPERASTLRVASVQSSANHSRD